MEVNRRGGTGAKKHSVIVKKLARRIPELRRECDNLVSTERIIAKFSTRIDKRSDFIDKEIEFMPNCENRINCFTDGSKTEDGAGAGYIVIGRNIKHSNSHPVDIGNSVFQTEILAIKDATEHLLEINTVGKQIKIFVDNQAAIRSQGKYNIKSKLVQTTKTKVNELAERNNVEISWVPGHSRIRGNMIADGKARLASRNPDFRERTVLPVNRAFYKQAIKDWGRKLHQKRWDRRTTCT